MPRRKMKPQRSNTIPRPPWLRDAHPENWVLVTIAARFYFRKSIVTVKRYIKTGYLAENGILSHWDGKRWYVRLPYALGKQHTQVARSEQNETRTG